MYKVKCTACDGHGHLTSENPPFTWSDEQRALLVPGSMVKTQWGETILVDHPFQWSDGGWAIAIKHGSHIEMWACDPATIQSFTNQR